MALTIAVNKTYELGDTDKLYVGTIAFDDSYPTGGEAFDITGNESIDSMMLGHKSGYTFSYDAANAKVIAYYVDNDAGADSAQIQIPNTTDLSAVTGVQFWAIGQ